MNHFKKSQPKSQIQFCLGISPVQVYAGKFAWGAYAIWVKSKVALIRLIRNIRTKVADVESLLTSNFGVNLSISTLIIGHFRLRYFQPGTYFVILVEQANVKNEVQKYHLQL